MILSWWEIFFFKKCKISKLSGNLYDNQEKNQSVRMVPSTYYFDKKFCFFVTILKYYIFMKKRNFFHVSNLKSEDMKKLRKIIRLFWYLWLPKMIVKKFPKKEIHIFPYIFFFSKKKCKWLIKWRKLPRFHWCNFRPNPTDTN